jgi:hypothetical protein
MYPEKYNPAHWDESDIDVFVLNGEDVKTVACKMGLKNVAGPTVRALRCGSNVLEIIPDDVQINEYTGYELTQFVKGIKFLHRAATRTELIKREIKYATESTQPRVQIVRPRKFKSIDDLIHDFDMSACKAAWDGVNVWITKDCHQSIRKETCTYYQDSKPERVLKYGERGFKMQMLDAIKYPKMPKEPYSNDVKNNTGTNLSDEFVWTIVEMNYSDFQNCKVPQPAEYKVCIANGKDIHLHIDLNNKLEHI